MLVGDIATICEIADIVGETISGACVGVALDWEQATPSQIKDATRIVAKGITVLIN